jgi:hypothetical protein
MSNLGIGSDDDSEGRKNDHVEDRRSFYYRAIEENEENKPIGRHKAHSLGMSGTRYWKNNTAFVLPSDRLLIPPDARHRREQHLN